MTAQRGAIFKTEKSTGDGVTTADGATVAEDAGVSLKGAQSALQEGNQGVTLGDPQIQKPSAIHERAR